VSHSACKKSQRYQHEEKFKMCGCGEMLSSQLRGLWVPA